MKATSSVSDRVAGRVGEVLLKEIVMGLLYKVLGDSRIRPFLAGKKNHHQPKGCHKFFHGSYSLK